MPLKLTRWSSASDKPFIRNGPMIPTGSLHTSRMLAHYFRSTDKKFDLIVYGLLDSHTALSGMSGVRLDSYIYTVEAFKQARSCLKDGGYLFLSFCVSDKVFGKKLFRMLEEAFDGQQPRVLWGKAATEVGALVFVIGGNSSLAATALPPDINDVTGEIADNQHSVDPSTDDWPFFYMPVRKYPVSYLVMITLLMVIAVLFIRPVIRIDGPRAAISWPCFLLGAGFMLLETKAITELALFYGSTWIVISIVILAILIMAYLANLTIIRWPGIPRTLSYILLLASLGASLWFSTVSGSLQGQWLSRILPTVVLTLPLFFSGLVFSAEMDASPSVSVAFGSNLIGAMVGGCLEYNSMYFGYRSLYILAIVVYGLSMLRGNAIQAANTSRRRFLHQPASKSPIVPRWQGGRWHGDIGSIAVPPSTPRPWRRRRAAFSRRCADRTKSESADFAVEHDEHNDRLEGETGQGSGSDTGLVQPRERQRDFHRGVHRDGHNGHDQRRHRVMQRVIGAIEDLLEAERPDRGSIEDDRKSHPLRIARREAAVLKHQTHSRIAHQDQSHAGRQTLK